MVDRAAVLKRFGLPNRDTFELEPCRDDFGLWRVKFSYEGDPAILMSQGHVARLADEIGGIDKQLAKQIKSCVNTARRYSKN